MTLTIWFSVALRASLILALGLLLSRCFRRSSALLRRSILLLTLGASLLTPAAVVAVHHRPIADVLPAPAVARVIAEQLVDGPEQSVATGNRPTFEKAANPGHSWQPWLLGIWALGATVVLLRALVGLTLARRLARRATTAEEGIAVSSEVDAPAVVGVFKPVIVLPSTSASWDAERRRIVLAHERAHVEQRDGVAVLLGQLAAALYWFQPLVWWVQHRLRREIERAADEAVLRTGLGRATYAEHLIALARPKRWAPGLSMAASPSELAQRIQELVVPSELPPPPGTRARALSWATSLALLALIGGTTATASEAAPPTATTSPNTSLDVRIQSIVEQEARILKQQSAATRVVIAVLDAKTSALLAMSDDSPGSLFVPASTIKPFTIALALDAGLVTPDQRFDCGRGTRQYRSELYGERTLRDAGAYGVLSTRDILAVSSNIGTSRIFDVLGGERLTQGLKLLQLGAPAQAEDGSLEGAMLSIGHGFAVRPLALAAAYASFANEGIYHPPHRGQGTPGTRVFQAATARTMLSLLQSAVAGKRATGKRAQIAGVQVAGKTGSSDWGGASGSFVGIVPANEPRYVIFVGVRSSAQSISGATVAAPAFARVAKQALATQASR